MLLGRTGSPLQPVRETKLKSANLCREVLLGIVSKPFRYSRTASSQATGVGTTAASGAFTRCAGRTAGSRQTLAGGNDCDKPAHSENSEIGSISEFSEFCVLRGALRTARVPETYYFRVFVVLFGGEGVLAAVLPARPALGRCCWHTGVSNTRSYALVSIEASCFDAKLCIGRLLSRSCCLAASGPRFSDEARLACCFFTKKLLPPGRSLFRAHLRAGALRSQINF